MLCERDDAELELTLFDGLSQNAMIYETGERRLQKYGVFNDTKNLFIGISSFFFGLFCLVSRIKFILNGVKV